MLTLSNVRRHTQPDPPFLSPFISSTAAFITPTSSSSISSLSNSKCNSNNYCASTKKPICSLPNHSHNTRVTQFTSAFISNSDTIRNRNTSIQNDQKKVNHTSNNIKMIAIPATLLLTPNTLLIAGGVVSFALSAALGANDVANSLGTAVGTGAMKITTALIIGALMEFLGAVFFGGTVTKTISSGVVTMNATALLSPVSYMTGMLSVLVGCTIWMIVATAWGLPVSSTHSVVGSLIGLGIISGWGICKQATLRIFASWFVSPLIGGIVSLFIYSIISLLIFKSDSPIRKIRRYLPVFGASASFVLAFSIFTQTMRFQSFSFYRTVFVTLAIALGCTGLASSLATAVNDDDDLEEDSEQQQQLSNQNQLEIEKSNGSITTNESTENEHAKVENLFKVLQVLTASLLAFSHGSNDVSNAIGPFAAMYSLWKNGSQLGSVVAIPLWVLLLGGIGISSGLALFGRPVMQTVGQRITKLKPSMGFCVEFSTALTVLMASRFGLPVSTTHTLIGCIIALGLSSGDTSKVNKNVILSIAGSWGITLPFSALVTILFYMMLRPFVPLPI